MPRLLQRAWLRGFLPAGGGASEAPLTSLRSHLSAHRGVWREQWRVRRRRGWRVAWRM